LDLLSILRGFFLEVWTGVGINDTVFIPLISILIQGVRDHLLTEFVDTHLDYSSIVKVDVVVFDQHLHWFHLFIELKLLRVENSLLNSYSQDVDVVRRSKVIGKYFHFEVFIVSEDLVMIANSKVYFILDMRHGWQLPVDHL